MGSGTTVRDVIRICLPAGSVVLGGTGGLEREVTWARTLRSRMPALDPLDGGELVLVATAVLAAVDQRLTVSRLLRQLAEAPASAVAALGAIDEGAARVADEVGLPLLLLPAGSLLPRLERAVISLVVDRQSEVQRRVEEVHQLLTRLALGEKGMEAIVRAAASAAGAAVVVQDEQGRLLAQAGTERLELTDAELAALLPAPRVSPSGSVVAVSREALRRPGLSRVWAPILVRESLAGYLSIVGRESGPWEFEHWVAGRAAAACAIDMARLRTVAEVENRLQRAFLDDLLSGNFASDEVMVDRGRPLGHDLRIQRGALNLAVEGIAVERVLDEVRGRAAGTIAATRAGRGVALVPVSATDSVAAPRRLADAVVQASTAAGGRATVGIGRIHPGVRGLAAAHREAEQAATIALHLFGWGRVAYFGELGVHRLLFPLQGSAELDAFRHEYLDALSEHDRHGDGRLLKTLQAFFACHGNVARTAERLYLHRNTLMYRLRRVQEITHLDLDDPDVRLALQLALKIDETREGVPPG